MCIEVIVCNVSVIILRHSVVNNIDNNNTQHIHACAMWGVGLTIYNTKTCDNDNNSNLVHDRFACVFSSQPERRHHSFSLQAKNHKYH